MDLIVDSLMGVLLRTILEISNRPQSTGGTMRLQFQDVTVREEKHHKRITAGGKDTAHDREKEKIQRV